MGRTQNSTNNEISDDYKDEQDVDNLPDANGSGSNYKASNTDNNEITVTIGDDVITLTGDDAELIKGKTKNQIIDDITDAYIDDIDLDCIPNPEEISIELVKHVQIALNDANKKRPKSAKFRLPDQLSFDQIAQLMAKLYPIACISCANNADEEYDLLSIYMDYGPDEGIYTPCEKEFYRLARNFNRRIAIKDFHEILNVLRSIVPRKTRCMDKDLIAVNNGIFNYATKQIHSFDPNIVFMSKSHVDYSIMAKNVIIHNDEDGTDWDVKSWMYDLFDNQEMTNLAWEVLGATIRPFVKWNKSAWFYSEVGNNGKGTLCELMRSLCGETAYASIPICDFSKDFALEPLTRSTAIIVDENDVGTFIDKAANLKAVITNDVISINRKFKTPISYQFYGFMVQCLNEFPRIKDKSDSFYRRQLFVPFTKSFTGRERKYIKNDYLHRKEVLEYVLYTVLNMNYYTLSEPDACKSVLAEYKEFNDPVRQYFEEFESKWVWDLLPFPFLYELYKQWFRKNSPTGTVQGKQKFINELVGITNQSKSWYCMDKQKTIRVGDKIKGPEPLIAEYDVVDWKNPTYMGGDINKLCTPKIGSYYRGLLRYNVSDTDDTDDGGEQHEDTD